MKFLLFNVVVAASLGYLLLGEDRNDTVAPVLSRIEAMASAAVETATSAVSDQKPAPVAAPIAAPVAIAPPSDDPELEVEAQLADEPVAKPAQEFHSARRAPAPVNQEVTVASAPEPTAEPATTQAAQVPALPPKLPAAAPMTKAAKVAASDPAAAQRRADVLDETPGATDQTETPQFMTPAERRRELARLAEDMELRFLEKVGN